MGFLGGLKELTQKILGTQAPTYSLSPQAQARLSNPNTPAVKRLNAQGLPGIPPLQQKQNQVLSDEAIKRLQSPIERDLKMLGGTMFGEISNAKDINEARDVAQVALNRAARMKASVGTIVSSPEFDAFGGEQYKKYMSDALDEPSRTKADLVNQVLDEIRNNELVGDPNGNVFFQHNKTTGKFETWKGAGTVGLGPKRTSLSVPQQVNQTFETVKNLFTRSTYETAKEKLVNLPGIKQYLKVAERIRKFSGLEPPTAEERKRWGELYVKRKNLTPDEKTEFSVLTKKSGEFAFNMVLGIQAGTGAISKITGRVLRKAGEAGIDLAKGAGEKIIKAGAKGAFGDLLKPVSAKIEKLLAKRAKQVSEAAKTAILRPGAEQVAKTGVVEEIDPFKLAKTPAYKKELQTAIGDQEVIAAHKDLFYSRPENYKLNTFYHFTTDKTKTIRQLGGKAQRFNKQLGPGLYVGRDANALRAFYGLETPGKNIPLKGTPKLLDLTKDFQSIDNAYASAKKAFPKEKYPLEKWVTDRGYDGVRYFDPIATGEEIVIYKSGTLGAGVIPPSKGIKEVVPEEDFLALVKNILATEEAKAGAPVKVSRTIGKQLDNIVNDEARILRDFDRQATVKTAVKEGGYVRVSEHSPEYRSFYKENNRPPNLEDWKDIATGKLKSGRSMLGRQEEFADLLKKAEVSGEALPSRYLPKGVGGRSVRITEEGEKLFVRKPPGIPPEKIVAKTEPQLLRMKLGAEAKGAKTGYVVGYREARNLTISKFREGNLTAQSTKQSVEQYARNVLAPADRGKFMVAVRDIKNPDQAARVFARIDRYAEKIEIRNAVADLRKVTDKMADSKFISLDYRNKIANIIDQYELHGHTQNTMDALKSTQDYINREVVVGRDVEMPQRILDKLKILGRTPGKSLTLNQIEGLKNEVELMAKLGETKWASKQALYDAEKTARTLMLNETAAPINSKVAGIEEIGQHKYWAEKWIKTRNYMQKTRIGITPIDGLADMTGMNPMKATLDLDYGNYLVHNDPVFREWLGITKGMNESNFERIGTMAIARQEGGLERLANSGITSEMVDRIKLTPTEEKVYQYVRKTFDDQYPAVKKYVLDVYNADVGKVDNYVSFMGDSDKMNDLEIYDRFGARPEEAIGRLTKTVEQGFTKARAGISQIKLQTNIDKIFHRHLDDVAYMLNMGRDIKMYYEIVNSPKMRQKLGDVGTLAWRQWLDLMARKGGTEGAGRIAALDVLRKNVTAGVLSLRLSSALVQFSSFCDTAGTIGIEWASKGARDIATSRAWRNFVMDNFPEVRKAIGDDVAFRDFSDNMFSKFAEKGLKPLQYFDGLMRSTAIAGNYEKLAAKRGIAINLEKPDRGLIQEATRLMRHSQGSSFFKDQPLAITSNFGLIENRSFNKAILTFQSFLLNRWDNIQRQIWRMGIKEGNYKQAVNGAIWLLVVATAAEEGLRRGSKAIISEIGSLLGGDKKQKQNSLTYDFAMNLVQNVPILGSLIPSLMYSSNPVPIINTAEEVGIGVSTFFKGKHWQTKAKGAIQFLGGVGTLRGVPGASQAAQIIRGIIPPAPTGGGAIRKGSLKNLLGGNKAGGGSLRSLIGGGGTHKGSLRSLIGP